MSAREDTTPQAIILRNVTNWRKTHKTHVVTPQEASEAQRRHDRQQRYWIRQGRIVSIAQAFPSVV